MTVHDVLAVKSVHDVVAVINYLLLAVFFADCRLLMADILIEIRRPR